MRYQAILSSFCEAETTSTSPSPSKSAALRETARAAPTVSGLSAPKLPRPSWLRYQATRFSVNAAGVAELFQVLEELSELDQPRD